MTAVGDFASDLYRFHSMIVNSSSLASRHQHQASQPHQLRTSTQSPPPSSRHHQGTPPRSLPLPHEASSTRSSHRQASSKPATTPSAHSAHCHQILDVETGAERDCLPARQHETPAATDDSRIPSPPCSASPVASAPSSAEDARPTFVATCIGGDNVSVVLPRSRRGTASHSSSSRQQEQQKYWPQRTVDALRVPTTTVHALPSPSSSCSYLSFDATPLPQTAEQHRQRVVHLRDIAHLRTLVADCALEGKPTGTLGNASVRYEISDMPIGDVIEMVAALLTKITTTNDLQYDAMQRNVAYRQQACQSSEANDADHMSPLGHSVLAFHGKNVPAITILSYLSRVHKYCPTTFEVFLSLLIYFDRMTERVNALVSKAEEARELSPGLPHPRHASTDESRRPRRTYDESDTDLADERDSIEGVGCTNEDDEMTDASSDAEDDATAERIITVPDEQAAITGQITYFVVDSFNIHRLIIAGVTCASKFFSDVFYTNSRYAKVGGLPLAELNHLEIQFLVLNDFRLAVLVEDLETYATMLVEFYAREVLSRKKPAAFAAE